MYRLKHTLTLKASAALLAGIFLFTDISAAAGRSGFGGDVVRSSGLSAALRSDPIAVVTREDDGPDVVSEDPRHISELSRDIRKKAGIAYISSIIVSKLEQFGSGQSPESIVRMIASHLEDFHEDIDLSDVRWQGLSKSGDVFTLRYEDEKSREREMLYSLDSEGRAVVRRGETPGEDERDISSEAGMPVSPEAGIRITLPDKGQDQELIHGITEEPDGASDDIKTIPKPDGAAIEAYKIRNSLLIAFFSSLAILPFYPYLPPIEAFVTWTAYVLTTGVLPVVTSVYINDRLSYRYYRKEHGLIRPFRRAENIRDLYDHDADSRDKISYYSYSTEKLYAEKAALRRIPKYIQYVIYFHEFLHGKLRVRTELVALSLTFCAPWAAAGMAFTAVSLFFLPASAPFFAGFTAWNAALPAAAYVVSRRIGVKRSFAGHNLLSGLKWKYLTEREIDDVIIAAVRKRTYDPGKDRMEYWRDWIRGGVEEKNAELIRVPGRPEDIVVVKAGYDPLRDGGTLEKAIRRSRKRALTLIIADDEPDRDVSRGRFSEIVKQAKRYARAPGVKARTIKADIRSARYDIRRLRDLRRFYRRRLDRIKYGNVAREAVASEVHGQLGRLRKLLDWLGENNIKHILFMGDYLGKKENGYEAIDMLEEHVSSGALPRITMLMGKSEHLFIRSILGDEKLRDTWPGLTVMEGPAVMTSLSRLAANAEKLLALFPEKERLKGISTEEITYMRRLTPDQLGELKSLPGSKKAILQVSPEDLSALQNLSDREIEDIIEADAFERAIGASIIEKGGEVSGETLTRERKRFYRFHPKILSLADFMAENMRFVYSENSHHNLFLIGSFPEDLERRGIKGIEALEEMEREFRNRTRCGLRLLKLISQMWMISRVPTEAGEKGSELAKLERKMLDMVREEKSRNREIGVELIPGKVLDSMESDLIEAIYDMNFEKSGSSEDTGRDIDAVLSAVLEHVAEINKGLPEIYDTVFQSESSPFISPLPHGMEAAGKGEDALYQRRMSLGVDAVSTPADFTRGFQTLQQVRVFTRSGRAVLFDVDSLGSGKPVFEETLAARTEEEIVDGRSLETVTRKKLAAVEEILFRYESLLPGYRPPRQGKRSDRREALPAALRDKARGIITVTRSVFREILLDAEWNGHSEVRISRIFELFSSARMEYSDLASSYKEGFERVAGGDFTGLITLEQVFASRMASRKQREDIMNEIMSHMKLNEDETARETAFEVFEEILSTTFSPGFEKFLNKLYRSAMDRIYPRLARVGSSENERKYRMYIYRHITNALIRNKKFRDYIREDAENRTDPREKSMALYLLEEAGKKTVLKDLLDNKIDLRYEGSFYDDITSREVFLRAYKGDMTKYAGDIDLNLRSPGSYPTPAYLDIMEYLEHPLKKKRPEGTSPDPGGHIKSDLLGKDLKVGDTAAARRARENAVFNITSGIRGMGAFLAASDTALLLMRALLAQKNCSRIKISGDFGRLSIRDGVYIWMDKWLFDIREESEFLPKLTIFTALLAHQAEHRPTFGSREDEFREEVRACAAEIRVYINAIRVRPGLGEEIKTLLAEHFDLDRIVCDDVLELARELERDTDYSDADGNFTAHGLLRISNFVAEHYSRFRGKYTEAGRQDDAKRLSVSGNPPGMLLSPGELLFPDDGAPAEGAVWSFPLQSLPGKMAENIQNRHKKLGTSLSSMKAPPAYLVSELFENARAFRSRLKIFIERYYTGETVRETKPTIEMFEAFLNTVETDLSSIEKRAEEYMIYREREHREKTYVKPSRAAIPERELKAAGKFIDTLAYHIFAKALRSGEAGGKIIIGVGTSMIPDEQVSAIQGLLNGLSHISRKKGMENIIIRRRKDASGLAKCLISERDKHGTPLSNMIILGDEDILRNKVFEPLRGGDEQKGAFFAGVRLSEGFSERSYIRMLEMIGMAVDLAFDKRVVETDHPHVKFFPDKKTGYRMYIFIPASTPFDLITLSELYRIQRREIDTRV